MAAVGSLFLYVFYFVLGASGLILLILTFASKRRVKPWTLAGGLGFLAFLGYLLYEDRIGYKERQLQQVGTYYLTSYPSCDSCVLELKDDMTYEIRSKGNVIETSNWHYEVGGDYWILYLDYDRKQLGSGYYAYKKSILRNPRTP